MNARQIVTEKMDESNLDPVLHSAALAAIGRINRLSAPAAALWREIRRYASDTPVRVLDVASGGGEVAIAISRRAKRKGLQLMVEGCDVSPHAVSYATEASTRSDSDTRFFVHDVVADGIPPGYDIVYSSLFFHHLENDVAARLLADCILNAKRLVIVNDLIRSRIGLALAYAVSRTITTSPVVRFDAPQSVRAAFTMAEFEALAIGAAVTNGRISWEWPFRFQFVSERDA